MWLTLAIIVALLLIALLAILFLPLGVEVATVPGGRRWYVILAGLHIPVPKSVTARMEQKARKKKDKPAKSKPKRSPLDLVHKLRRLRGKDDSPGEGFELADLRFVLELIVHLLQTLHIRVHRLHILIATPDPALTGMAYGMTWAVIGALALPPGKDVSVEADWTNNKPEFRYDVEVYVIPMQVLGAIVRTIWK